MGKSTQYRNWAVTWLSGEHKLTRTTKDGFDFTGGDYSYTIFVGPEEDPDSECSSCHQHVLVHCKTANVTKRKAKEALVEYSSLAPEIVEANVTYISKVYSSKSNYIIYCFKGDNNNSLGKDDTIVIDTVNTLKNDGRTPVSSAIKRKLIDDHGATAFNKRFKMVLETYLAETDITDTRGNPIVKLDSKDNCTNFLTVLLCWFALLTKTNVSTMCKPFDIIPHNMLKQITFLISIIPYFSKRVVGMADGLPSLYLWGIQSAGKSSIFSNCRYIKKIPTDAAGVSRFRMDKMHTALLLDDVENDTINHKDNSSTLKQLTLGNDVEVKVMGATQSIKGFVIITSNTAPSYTDDTSVTTNDDGTTDNFVNRGIINASWKRRFITCEFTSVCPFDYVSIDYDDFKLRDVAAQLFRANYIQLISKHPEIENCLGPLNTYYDITLNDYASETDDDSFSDIFEVASNRVNEMIKANNVQDMMLKE